MKASIKDGEIGLKIFTPYVFEDHRGSYIELYDRPHYQELGVDVDFVQEDISITDKNVLRGLHGDHVTWKLVTCLRGSLYSVILDMNEDSPTYRQWAAVGLNDKTKLQVLIPPGYGKLSH